MSAETEKRKLLDTYTASQLRDLARAHGIRIVHPTKGKKPIGILLEDLVAAGITA